MVKFLIHRPIAVFMSTLGIAILGMLAALYVPISLMPDIDIPEITIQIDAKGHSARELEDIAIDPLRTQLVQLANLENLESRTSNGKAIIRLKLTHGSPVDYAFIEANEKVDRIMGSLPRNIERPRVIKASATDIPVLYLDLTLKKDVNTAVEGEVSQQFIDFSRFVEHVLAKRIEQIPEVALVDINGLVRSEIIIVPDEEKLIALGLGNSDIENAIKKKDIDIGSILVKDNQYQYNLQLGTSLANVDDLAKIHIKKNGRIFQLNELVEITQRPQERTGAVLSNGKEAVTLAMIKQGDARMGDLKQALEKTVGQMKNDYPQIDFTIMRDQTKLLDLAISNLVQSLFWGLILAFLIMFFFLKDFRSPILIGISVPISLLVCLLLFHLLNISINIVSLSGLILGIGLMIDNAIIVIDNIAQNRSRGLSLSMACEIGTNEVFRPLLSSVLTTCAVFVPLIFLSGISGALFYDQAMAVSIGLFASLLVSTTFLPVLYKVLHSKKTTTTIRLVEMMKKTNRTDYGSIYEKGFRYLMRRQNSVFMAAALLALMTIGFFLWLPKRQLPKLTSTDTIVKIDWNAPIHTLENKKRVLKSLTPFESVTKEYNAQIGQQQFLLDSKTNTGMTQTLLYLNAIDEGGLEDIKKVLGPKIRSLYPTAVVEYGEVENLFNLIFPEDIPTLTARIRTVNKNHLDKGVQLKKLWDILNQKLHGEVDLPPIPWEEHIILRADGEKLMTYDVDKSLLDDALKKALNEKEMLSLISDQEEIPIKLGSGETLFPKVLSNTLVMADDSTYYHIADFVKETRVQELKTIVSGKEGEYYPLHLNPRRGLESITMEKVQGVVDQNPEFDVYFTGTLFKNKELVRELAMVLGVTLLLLYFILASQFESLMLPLVILMEVPVALAGALGSLALFGMDINLMSMIGIVVMCGIIINDSILKIDTIIQLRKQGFSLIHSLLVGAQRRLKPILMTSLTTILALVPVLLAGGLGGELQAPLAIALIGGMVIGTMVSLYLVPLCYYHLEKNKKNAH